MSIRAVGAPAGYPATPITQTSIDLMLHDEFVQICDTYQTQINRAQTDLSVLNKGAWYAIDYYDLLVHHNERSRKPALISRNSFYFGHPPEGMQHKDASSHHFYVLKESSLPTTVLDNIGINSFCFIDCTMTLEMAYYRVLRRIWGDETFNHYFRKGGPTPFVLSSSFERTHLLFFAVVLLDERLLTKGVCCGFLSHKDHHTKHPLSHASGYNLICVDETYETKKFTALGLPSTGLTMRELQTVCANEFNKDPAFNRACVSPKLWKETIDPRDTSTPLQEKQLSIDDVPNKLITIHHLALSRITACITTLPPRSIREALTQDTLNATVSAKMQELCQTYESLKAKAQLDPSALQGGLWYANDYYDYLEKHRPSAPNLLKNSHFFYWGLPPDGMKLNQKHRYYYILDGTLSPSKVLDRLGTEVFVFIDCLIAVQIVFYQTVRSVWGDTMFNEFFSETGDTPFVLSILIEETPFNILVSDNPFLSERPDMTGAPGSKNVQQGDYCGFSNDSRYLEKHPLGAAGSYNLICVDATPKNQKFATFGAPSSGLTEDELTNLSIEEFNKPQEASSKLAVQGLVPHVQSEITTSRKEFTRHDGGLSPSRYHLDLTKLLALKARFDHK